MLWEFRGREYFCLYNQDRGAGGIQTDFEEIGTLVVMKKHLSGLQL